MIRGGNTFGVDLDELAMATISHHRPPLVVIETIVGRTAIGKTAPAAADGTTARLRAKTIFKATIVQDIDIGGNCGARPSDKGHHTGDKKQNNCKTLRSSRTRGTCAYPLRGSPRPQRTKRFLR